jgi:hypothetical protein
MNENQESYKLLLQSYTKKDSRYIYCDKNLEPKGINYQIFTKLRYESINKGHIRHIYTINGWYVLWYLMSNATNNLYIKISLQEIISSTGLSEKNIINILEYLKNNNIIFFNDNIHKINKNDNLHIIIGYNDNSLYKEYINSNSSEGFDPIPTEYIKTIIETLSPTAWAIYTVLCVHFNYYYASSFVDKTTGEIKYFYSENCYSFPTQKDICEILDINKKTFKKYLNELLNSNFNLISEQSNEGQIIHYSDNRTNQHRIKGRNNIYTVHLYRRIEYVYYCILQMEDTRDEKIKNKIKKKGFENIALSEEQNILWTKDYIEYKFGELVKKYKECLESNDQEQYKFLRQEFKITP